MPLTILEAPTQGRRCAHTQSSQQRRQAATNVANNSNHLTQTHAEAEHSSNFPSPPWGRHLPFNSSCQAFNFCGARPVRLCRSTNGTSSALIVGHHYANLKARASNVRTGGCAGRSIRTRMTWQQQSGKRLAQRWPAPSCHFCPPFLFRCRSAPVLSCFGLGARIQCEMATLFYLVCLRRRGSSLSVPLSHCNVAEGEVATFETELTKCTWCTI